MTPSPPRRPPKKQKINVKGYREYRVTPHGVDAHKKTKKTILQMRKAGNDFIQSMNTYLAEKHLAAHEERARAILEGNIYLVLTQRRWVSSDIPQGGVMRIYWDDNASRHDVMRNGFSILQKAIMLDLLAATRARKGGAGGGANIAAVIFSYLSLGIGIYL